MKKGKIYQRVRGDSGQHRTIVHMAVLWGILAFIPIGVRLFQMMVVQYDYYREKALNNQTRVTAVKADRGEIYDRNMNVLATSETVEDLYLDPRELKQSKADLDDIASFLSDLLNLDASWIKQQGQNKSMRYKRIASSLPQAKADEIRRYINESGVSGIHLEPNTKRVYPYGTLASQLIGFTNASNTGCEGVEASYDSYLSGKEGKVVTTKGNNEMDMPYSYEDYVTADDGCSVILTIDTTVQACLEKQMQNAIERYDVQNGAFGIVMNVNTGEILAMATLQGYDPNNYLTVADSTVRDALEQQKMAYTALPKDSSEYIAGKKAYTQALQEARLKQWRNRCISDGYEPGSTFKILTMAAALDCGAIDLTTSFYCSGSEQIPGRAQKLHCWRSAGHGAEQTPEALQNSCNIAFAHIALKLGGMRFYNAVQTFGITEKTNIDLSGESKGVFFSKELVTDTDKWGTASLTSGSFGQTFKITPLQLVRAAASVVNGGKLLEPYVVSSVIDADGNTVLAQEPTVTRQTVSAKTSETMCALLRSVVEVGTAKNAKVAAYDIGGKTGTSEKIDVFDGNGRRVQDKIVSFLGVAPMSNPQYITLIALDTPSRSTGIYISGGVMAAPTVGAVFSEILPYLQVETKEETAQICLDSYIGMTAREAAEILRQQGITAVTVGTEETVTDQLPLVGRSVPAGGQVLLYCGETPETVEVPDCMGLSRAKAAEALKKAGLNAEFIGNTDDTDTVTVTVQSKTPGARVKPGLTVRLTMTDTKAED